MAFSIMLRMFLSIGEEVMDNVKSVCEGTNKKNDKQYYYDRKQNVGDYHGQAPYLWCAVALLEE